ncbi:MAG: transport system ATP-binding/permease protein [Micromonosporaceae bacterium]|nr:transport system ATP-binding/permease protein [Micromonosporaceae bacterium]
MANIINLDKVSKSYGAAGQLLTDVSLGLDDADRVGVVGLNGAGKSTLLRLLMRVEAPDSGRATHRRDLRVLSLPQTLDLAPTATVRDVVVGEAWLPAAFAAEHEWAGDSSVRTVLSGLGMPHLGLDAPVGPMSGGERRRVALAALLVRRSDILVLDEPTNHLDIAGITWLARHLLGRRGALVVVTHDRWFLDAVCEKTWEVADGTVRAYEGGYAAWILARAERLRVAAATEARRQNLLRKEIAWLRRGPPARTTKPKFRIDAANELIADVPEPRDSVSLRRLATARLGKQVYELAGVTVRVGASATTDKLSGAPATSEKFSGASATTDKLSGAPATSEKFSGAPATSGKLSGASATSGKLSGAPATSGTRTLLDRVDWLVGPGDRIGIVGANGAGKSTLLRLLAGTRAADEGRINTGTTVRPAFLSQELAELPGSVRVLEAVEEVARRVNLGGRELSAGQLAEVFGFTERRLWTPVSDLSGGERRRLQMLRLLAAEPNVLLLDEPTNDLDTDTLASLEDLLDTWPGTMIIASHDRYLVERVCDTVYAMFGDGRLTHLPGGVDEYLARLDGSLAPDAAPGSMTGDLSPERDRSAQTTGAGAADQRAAKKELARLERQIAKLDQREAQLHEQMATHATDYEKVSTLDAELRGVLAERSGAEEAWLELADRVGSG